MSENFVLQVLEGTLGDEDVLTVSNAIYIFKNIVAPDMQNQVMANSCSQQPLDTTPSPLMLTYLC
jgi:hypothetical protein